MEVVIGIVVVTFGILQLILFFKLWGMTNDVSEIKNFLIKKSVEKEILLEAEIVENKVVKNEDLLEEQNGWAKDITEAEKIEAMPIVNKLKSEQVIAKIISDKRMEVWDLWFWKSKRDNPDYKLIYKK